MNVTCLLLFSTYFVEYQFPVVATSRDKYAPNAMATEVMRVASKKITDDGKLTDSVKLKTLLKYKLLD